MEGNTRKAALGAVRLAEEKIKEVREVLTIENIRAVIDAMKSSNAAHRAILEHIDAIE